MIGHPIRQLLLKGNLGQSLAGRKRDVVAIDTAAGPLAAVSIGAGETCININLADPAAKAVTQIVAVRIDPQILVQ